MCFQRNSTGVSFHSISFHLFLIYSSFSLWEILQDRSDNKNVSHGRIVTFINRHQGTAPLSRVYNKLQLVALCEAYNVRVLARSTKTVIGEALLNAIAQHTSIPFITPVDDRIFRVAERTESNDGHIRIRLSRGNCNDISFSGNGSLTTTDCKLKTLGGLNIRQSKPNNQTNKERQSL